MKLWQKISLINISVLLIVVVICSALLLIQAKDNMIQLTTEQAKAEQRNLAVSFSGMTQYYLKDENNTVAKNSGIQYCFSHFANDTSVLIGPNRTIYSSVSIDPAKALPLEEGSGQKTITDDTNGRHVSLGLMRVTEKNVGDSGLVIPVWDFFGTITLKDAQGNKREQWGDGYTAYLTINAIDGSVIDRDLGY